MMDGPMLRGGYVPHSEAVKPAVAPAARDHVMQTICGRELFEIVVVPAEDELHPVGLSNRLEQLHELGLIEDAIRIPVGARVRA